MSAAQKGVERRKAILKFADRYIADKGTAPGLAEIAQGVDCTTMNVYRHLVILRDQGWVSWDMSWIKGALRIHKPDIEAYDEAVR